MPGPARSGRPGVRRFWARLRLAVIVVFLMLCGVGGLFEGGGGVGSARTLGPRIVAWAQLFYGAFALAALLAMIARRGWVFPLLLVWGAALIVAGGAASVVYGETSLLVGAAGAASVAVLVALVFWGWRKDVQADAPLEPVT